MTSDQYKQWRDTVVLKTASGQEYGQVNTPKEMPAYLASVDFNAFKSDPFGNVFTPNVVNAQNTYRNATKELNDKLSNHSITEQQYIDALRTGTNGAGPVFDPTKGPQIDMGQGPQAIQNFQTNPGSGTGFSGIVNGQNFNSQATQTQPNVQSGVAQAQQNSPSFSPTQANLGKGSSGNDVLALQQWLVSQGYLTQAQLSTGPGIYGPQTTAAVAAWQKANNIDTQGNPGYFGPISRAFLSSNTGQNSGTSAGNSSGTTGTTGTTTGSGTTTGTSGTTAPDLSGTPDWFKPVFEQLEIQLQKLQANGQSINPNITITPDQVAQFTAQARNEIDPYYATQLKLATDSFLKGVGYSDQQILDNEQTAQQTYGNQVRQIGEGAADQGFAQSGLRTRQEDQLAQTTQQSLDQARNALYNQNSNTAATFAQNYGAPPTAPTLASAPRVLSGVGQFQTDNSQVPVYQLSNNVYNGLIGKEQYQNTADVSQRASQLEGAFRQNLADQQTRSLTL